MKNSRTVSTLAEKGVWDCFGKNLLVHYWLELMDLYKRSRDKVTEYYLTLMRKAREGFQQTYLTSVDDIKGHMMLPNFI